MASQNKVKRRVYVAGAFHHKERVQAIQDFLKEKGFEITHDWTRVELEGERTPQQAANMAKLDTDGVKSADILVVDMTDKEYVYRGSFTEIGIALGKEIPVCIICPDGPARCKSNVFYWHPSIGRFPDMDCIDWPSPTKDGNSTVDGSPESVTKRGLDSSHPPNDALVELAAALTRYEEIRELLEDYVTKRLGDQGDVPPEKRTRHDTSQGTSDTDTTSYLKHLIEQTQAWSDHMLRAHGHLDGILERMNRSDVLIEETLAKLSSVYSQLKGAIDSTTPCQES